MDNHDKYRNKNELFILYVTGPSPEFSRHILIKPQVYHGRTKRQLSTTNENVRIYLY